MSDALKIAVTVRTPPLGRGPKTLARVAADDAQFNPGDYVVYPTHGVGKVDQLLMESVLGQPMELILISFEETRMTLRVPVEKARTSGLRKLAPRAQFDQAMALLRTRPKLRKGMWSKRALEYLAKINSGDPMAVAEVVRDLHRKPDQPEPSFSERQLYESALDRMAAELAALDQTDRPTAVLKLSDHLNK